MGRKRWGRLWAYEGSQSPRLSFALERDLSAIAWFHSLSWNFAVIRRKVLIREANSDQESNPSAVSRQEDGVDYSVRYQFHSRSCELLRLSTYMRPDVSFDCSGEELRHRMGLLICVHRSNKQSETGIRGGRILLAWHEAAD